MPSPRPITVESLAAVIHGAHTTEPFETASIRDREAAIVSAVAVYGFIMAAETSTFAPLSEPANRVLAEMMDRGVETVAVEMRSRAAAELEAHAAADHDNELRDAVAALGDRFAGPWTGRLVPWEG